MDHTLYDKFMPAGFSSRNGSQGKRHMQSADFAGDAGLEKLEAVLNLSAPENAPFLREYSDARKNGLLSDLHILSYIGTRRIDEGLDSL